MYDDVELVVLASEDGARVGTAPKATVHTADTPLHFAFSCYLLDDEGRLLVTRRALSKTTWVEELGLAAGHLAASASSCRISATGWCKRAVPRVYGTSAQR